MLPAAYQKVYDKVMALPVGNEDSYRRCDVCGEQQIAISQMYVFPHDKYDERDCCSDCRENKMIERIVEPVDRTNSTAGGSWKCDLCDKKLGDGDKWFANVQNDLDVCNKCYGFSNERITTRRADPSFRYTPRGLRLKFVDPSTINYGKPASFDTFIHSLAPERCEGWAREWKDLVKVPTDFVWMEWARFAPWNKVANHQIWTSFIVRCVKDQDMQVAVLSKNDRGEISVTVCFQTSDIFLANRDAFLERVNTLSPEQLRTSQASVAAKFSSLSDRQARNVASIATTDFSEFVWLTCDC